MIPCITTTRHGQPYLATVSSLKRDSAACAAARPVLHCCDQAQWQGDPLTTIRAVWRARTVSAIVKRAFGQYRGNPIPNARQVSLCGYGQTGWRTESCATTPDNRGDAARLQDYASAAEPRLQSAVPVRASYRAHALPLRASDAGHQPDRSANR